jgi:hypothetical protein
MNSIVGRPWALLSTLLGAGGGLLLEARSPLAAGCVASGALLGVVWGWRHPVVDPMSGRLLWSVRRQAKQEAWGGLLTALSRSDEMAGCGDPYLTPARASNAPAISPGPAMWPTAPVLATATGTLAPASPAPASPAPARAPAPSSPHIFGNMVASGLVGRTTPRRGPRLLRAAYLPREARDYADQH